MYRFLLSPRWLGYAALAVLAAAVMGGLASWQYSRYQARHQFNERVAAAAAAAPVPLTAVLPVAAPPTADRAFAKVAVTGRYDPAHQILARERSHDGTVGYEVLTPLVLADGSAVLVDRGWLPPGRGAAPTGPVVPPTPAGQVDVVGRVHLPESRPDPPRTVAGGVQVRRIDPARLAGAVPYPLRGGYLLLDSQRPAADPAFAPIDSDHQNDVLNLGYTAQWWIFAGMTLIGFGWAARRQALGPDRPDWRAELDEEPARLAG